MYVLRKQNRLNFAAVDEAHVIDTWGLDFRPLYHELGTLRKFDVPFVALTGTATEATINEIKLSLVMFSPKIIRVPFMRKNVQFEVLEKQAGKAAIQQIIALINERFLSMTGIIYCPTHEDCEVLALELKKSNHRTILYHGGIIDPEIKVKHTTSWLEDKFEIMCATNAFGIDIDKADVRFLIYLAMPSSLEAMIQECGRAGRDNDEARCVIVGKFEDRTFHLRCIVKLKSDKIRNKRLASLNDMTRYMLETRTCRQSMICSYFGYLKVNLMFAF